MVFKIMLSIVIAFFIFANLCTIEFFINKKNLNLINKNILNSIALYFARQDIKEENFENCKKFILSRLGYKSLKKVSEMNMKKLSNDSLVISYVFKTINNEKKLVSFKVKRND